MFGKSDKEVAWAFTWGSRSPVITWVIIFVIIIVIIGFANIGGQELLEENPEFASGEEVEVSDLDSEPLVNNYEDGELNPASSDYSSNFLATFIHPKVIGMLMLCVVGMIAILLLTKSGFTPDR